MDKKSIILTGGAGFIGSAFLWKLNSESIDDIIVVDNLGGGSKKKNLDGRKFRDYIQKDEFLKLVEKNKLSTPKSIIHMGACSSTTLDDDRYFRKNNFEYSKTLALWAARSNTPFQYASSAATYGSGEFGYNDSNETTRKLKPLNLYGHYKQLFDLWVLDNGFEAKSTGIKFFNVFGPNEYHKGEMMSVVCKKFKEVKDQNQISLFKSYQTDYPDGEQKRDFIYIKDAVEVMYWFFLNPGKTGIFNLGTGLARSWNDLARAMFSGLGKAANIKYIEMPEYLKEKYQYFTEARMEKLNNAGCKFKFRSLEDSVKDYMEYLKDERCL